MPLATFKELLGDAKAGKYAVGSFNAWDAYSAKNIVGTAQRMRSPLIISLWQPELDLAGERELYQACLSFGRSASVPVALFIDHAQDLDAVERAIRFGATSVMIDGSHLPLGDNIRLTSRAAALAHGAGVSIEGEIGVLGEEDGSEPEEKNYTDVREAELFVKETGVDALAVAIGNAHGFYKQTPKLDFERLASIRSRVESPLVLHGGSGIPPGDIQRAIGIGITKVNIGAEARSAFMQGLRRSLAEAGEHEKFPHRVFPAALECHARLIEEKMALLLSRGKA
jgi:fructose-bisphosphate aldolase class II